MPMALAALLSAHAAYSTSPAPRLGRTSKVHCLASDAGDVVACDLNGVLVDSQSECMRSAWIAARELWPEAFESASELASKPWRAGARKAWAGGDWEPLQGVGEDGLPNWLDAKMKLLRPVLEGGSDVSAAACSRLLSAALRAPSILLSRSRTRIAGGAPHAPLRRRGRCRGGGDERRTAA